MFISPRLYLTWEADWLTNIRTTYPRYSTVICILTTEYINKKPPKLAHKSSICLEIMDSKYHLFPSIIIAVLYVVPCYKWSWFTKFDCILELNISITSCNLPMPRKLTSPFHCVQHQRHNSLRLCCVWDIVLPTSCRIYLSTILSDGDKQNKYWKS